MPPGPDPEIDRMRILEIFVVSPEPAMVPSEIADDMEVTTNGARHQMDNLVERGFLDKKKPGERTVIYWITQEGANHYAEHSERSCSDLGQ